jgi:hypothetical protein
VLRRIFELKMGEIIGGWGKLHIEYNSCHSSLNMSTIIKSRRTRWAGKPEGKRL